MKIFLLLMMIAFQAQACLWMDGTSIDGSVRRIGDIFPAAELRRAMKEHPDERIYGVTSMRNQSHSDDSLLKESEAVREVLSGNQGNAIVTLEQLELEHPGRYSTAANIGTAYELNGELETALKWIREGIRRNPESHHGTEWLHVEILKARIKLKEDPGHLSRNRVITLPQSYSAASAITIDGHQYRANEISKALLHQLKERMIFVKTPDPIVADLLFTFGEIEAHTGVLESGLELFKIATEYGFPDHSLIASRTTYYERLILWAKIKQWSIYTAGVLMLVLFLWFAHRKRWFFLTAAAYRKHQLDKLSASPL